VHAETGIMINISFKCQLAWKLDSNKLAYNSNFTKITI